MYVSSYFCYFPFLIITLTQGRLGSLGTIPDKYDVAISTACPALNNLVVDTVEQGQACIEYLRKQNIGRASFLVLEKLPVDGRLDKIATPENVPRLFDLVKPKDTKFAPAFFKGLGNTLVVDDLDQANRIAYGQQKRWRVVTLAGQLFDTSGTMSGGGTKVAKGGMSSKLASDAVQPAVMKQYEADSGKAQEELEELVAQRRALETELERFQKELPKVDLAISKVELDIQTADKRNTEAEKRIKELRYVIGLSTVVQESDSFWLLAPRASRTLEMSSASRPSRPRLHHPPWKSTNFAKRPVPLNPPSLRSKKRSSKLEVCGYDPRKPKSMASSSKSILSTTRLQKLRWGNPRPNEMQTS